jgi:hypothetical protein
MVSGRDVLYVRLSDTPVDGAQMYPIKYDFFTSRTPTVGSRLVLRGCSPELVAAMEGGIHNFFHPANSLIGPRLWKSGGFELYRSTSPDGHIFYQKLKRGSIPDIPLVLVIHKEYAAMEKKIGSDRDRNAFGELLLKTAYNLFTRYGTSKSARGQRVIVEAAKPCWERGHPLLAEVAGHCRYRWSQSDISQVFGHGYYAKCTSGQAGIQVRYDEIEEKWHAAGRIPLPNYFRKFGLRDAQTTLRRLDAQADEEARAVEEARDRKASPPPTPAEAKCLEFLSDVGEFLVPRIMKTLRRQNAVYRVAKTKALHGKLTAKRRHGAAEVFLATDFFMMEFPEALSVFLHEHAHIFGYDGSRGFTDALTEMIGTVVRARRELDEFEEVWLDCRIAVEAERVAAGGVEPRRIEALV